MSGITPAIISSSFEEIKTKIASLEGVVPWVHLDIIDGSYAPVFTWQTPDDLENIHGNIKIEVHLMIEKPEEFLELWVNKADRILIHFETTDRLNEILESSRFVNSELGLVLELDTPLEKISPYLPELSFIQLMSIRDIGFQGHSFEQDVLEKIRSLRSVWPEGKIQVDGGIDLDTGQEALKVGADILVAGSSIWRSGQPLKVIKDFESILASR